MTLKDLLKKKDKIKDEGATRDTGATLSPDVPEFTFMRTTTTSQEVIAPPSFPGDPSKPRLSAESPKRHSRFRRHSSASHPNKADGEPHEQSLAGRLHIGRHRSSSSVNVPENLPTIEVAVAKTEEDEANWEKRATLLAKGNSIRRSGDTTPNYEEQAEAGRRSRSVSVSKPADDVGSGLTNTSAIMLRGSTG